MIFHRSLPDACLIGDHIRFHAAPPPNSFGAFPGRRGLLPFVRGLFLGGVLPAVDWPPEIISAASLNVDLSRSSRWRARNRSATSRMEGRSRLLWRQHSRMTAWYMRGGGRQVRGWESTAGGAEKRRVNDVPQWGAARPSAMVAVFVPRRQPSRSA